MIDNLEILLPEIFLSLSIFTLLMLGVFVKNSYGLVTKLSIVTLIISIFIILNYDQSTIKVFQESFIRDNFSDFI